MEDSVAQIVVMGVEGPTKPRGAGGAHSILTDPARNGWTGVDFPSGARLAGIVWQSTAKVGSSEILSAVRVDGLDVLCTHHLGKGIVTKSFSFPEDLSVRNIRLIAFGWGAAHPAGFEIQVSFFLMGNPEYVYVF